MNNLLIITLICFTISLPQTKPNNISNHHNSLVFKQCNNDSYNNHQSQTLSALFQELISHSSKSKYFRTSESDGGDFETAISGMFQCRQDITGEECRNCVTKLQHLSKTLCGESKSAHVQLRGCYVKYEPDQRVTLISGNNDLLHKTCGEIGIGVGIEEMRSAAFAMLEDEITGRETGRRFWRTVYEAVAVAAQCEGGIEGCKCGECMSEAVRIAEEECGSAFSGEVYLDKCFVTYSYFHQGIPTSYYPGQGENEDEGGKGNEGGIEGKVVAIVIGGAATLGLGIVFVLFIKSCTKKDDD